MINPSLLFVYRMARDGDEFAARCICCDAIHRNRGTVKWSGQGFR